jgi:hypothetical protein
MNPSYTPEEQQKIDLVKSLVDQAFAAHEQSLDEAMEKVWNTCAKGSGVPPCMPTPAAVPPSGPTWRDHARTWFRNLPSTPNRWMARYLERRGWVCFYWDGESSTLQCHRDECTIDLVRVDRAARRVQ